GRRRARPRWAKGRRPRAHRERPGRPFSSYYLNVCTRQLVRGAGSRPPATPRGPLAARDQGSAVHPRWLRSAPTAPPPATTRPTPRPRAAPRPPPAAAGSPPPRAPPAPPAPPPRPTPAPPARRPPAPGPSAPSTAAPPTGAATAPPPPRTA